METLKFKLNKGFMAVEVLVATSIILASILVAMAVTEKAISFSRQSFHISQASFLLEEGAEIVRIARDNSWDDVSSLNVSTDYYPVFTDGVWSFSLISSKIGIFDRKINISNVKRNASTSDISTTGTNDVGTKLVTVTVSWTEGGRMISKNLSFYVMDIFS
ncbi:MAG: hypothetical protein WA101_01210 [Minisyncoccia bacterium]